MALHEEGFLKAYDAYADAIFRHAYFRLGDRDRALDVMQDTFCRVWKSYGSGESVGNMRALLYRIAGNLVIDEIRKKKTLSLDALAEDGFDPEASDDGSMARETYGEIIALMREMEEEDRVPLLLRYVDDLSPKDIAETLGITENAASVRIHRALAKVRALAGQKDISHT